jgi:hypothetical protein
VYLIEFLTKYNYYKNSIYLYIIVIIIKKNVLALNEVAVNSNLQAENTLDHIQIFLFSPPMFLLAPLKFQFYPHNFWKTFFIIHIFSEYIFQNILKFSISDSTHILVFQILFSKMLTFLENIFRIFKYFGTQNQKLLLENIFQSDFGKCFPKSLWKMFSRTISDSAFRNI